MDAKRYKGLIEIRNRGPIWRRERRLFVGGRDRTVLAEGMGWQVEAVRSALSRSDVEPPPPITAVLCFIDGEWPFFRPPKEFEGVRLETERSIRKLLNASEMLGAEEIVRLAGILAAALPSK